MTQQFVQWFRDSSPYIHAYRNSTVVIGFGGEALLNPDFYHHVHDFALLNSLGIRLVLVHGIRPQIDQRLSLRNQSAQFHNGLRITDPIALECVKEAAGHVRVELEALFTTSLSNSPMAGARIRVASGNVVIAKPYGVHAGIDYGYTGKVRRIDSDAIQQKLAQDNIVLISPIGYSVSGEVFNLSAESVATAVAISLGAEKLMLMSGSSLQQVDSNIQARQMTTSEGKQYLEQQTNNLDIEQRSQLLHALEACENGVQRVHLLNHTLNGVVLQELFSRDGSGTLISTTPFEELRTAGLDDISGILDLITPLERQGILAPRSRETLETNIHDYAILERDGLVLGCAALHCYLDEQLGELACLAIHPDYQGAQRAQRLLNHLLLNAQQHKLRRIVILTTQTSDWFREHGFQPGSINDLPAQRQAQFNANRNSRVLYRHIE